MLALDDAASPKRHSVASRAALGIRASSFREVQYDFVFISLSCSSLPPCPAMEHIGFGRLTFTKGAGILEEYVPMSTKKGDACPFSIRMAWNKCHFETSYNQSEP